MGAWGFKPFDNDDAADWLWLIERPIVKTIEKTLAKKTTHYSYMEKVAAAAMLAELSRRESHVNISYQASEAGLFDKAIEFVKSIQGGELVAEWDKPAEYSRELSTLLSELQARKRESARCRKKTAAIFATAGTRKRKARVSQSPAGGKA